MPVQSQQPVTVETSARRFLLTFLATSAACIVALLALSWWGNVWQNHGDKGFFTLYNDRKAKSEFLLRLRPEQIADAWILGSSNMMPFQPMSVERRFGYRTFNLGVFWGRIEDAWCWMNFIVNDLHRTPKLVIIGVEPWTFGPGTDGPSLFPHLSRRLLNTPALVKHLGEYSPLKHALSKLGDDISAEQVRSVVTMAFKRRFQRTSFQPLEKAGFLPDGTSSAYNRTNPPCWFLSQKVEKFYQDIAAGNLKPGDPAVEDTRNNYLNQGLSSGKVEQRSINAYMPGDKLRPESLTLFRRLIALCQARGTQVVVVVLPVQPFFYDMLSRETGHRQNLTELLATLNGLQREFSTVKAVVNASQIGFFKGDPTGFHDNFHMTPANCERVLDLVEQQIEAAK